MDEIITDAIRSKKQLVFSAKEHLRIVCPHVFGMKNGQQHLFCWQINDESEKGFEPGAQRWRCFDLDDISNLRAQPGEWYRGWTSGTKPQSCVDMIICAVDASHAAEVRSISQIRTR